jgi:hypothetical protein
VLLPDRQVWLPYEKLERGTKKRPFDAKGLLCIRKDLNPQPPEPKSGILSS